MNFLFALMQIVVESLPVSSSGHLQLFGLHDLTIWDRFLHGPTVLVLLWYFHQELWSFVYDFKERWPDLLRWMILLVFANSVTVLVYALMDKFELSIPLWLGFASTGSVLFSLYWSEKSTKHVKSGHPLMVMGCLGFVQGLARLPGVSRLGVTYTAASWLGFSPAVSFRISCALQVPLFSIGFLEGLWGLLRSGQLNELINVAAILVLIIGMVGAYFLLAFIERLMISNRLWWLGIYMIIPTVLALLK